MLSDLHSRVVRATLAIVVTTATVSARAEAPQAKSPSDCTKLADADRADPKVASAQARARCEKRAGRKGAALAALRDVASRAAAAKDAAAERAARAEIAALEKAMPKLTVKVDASTASLEGATVSLDGRPLDKKEWNAPVAVDPGKHRVEASARDKKPFATDVDVAARGDSTATVPALEDATVSHAITVKEPTVVDHVGDARWESSLGFVLEAKSTEPAPTEAGGGAGSSAPPEADAPRVPSIGRLYHGDFDFALMLGGTQYDAGTTSKLGGDASFMSGEVNLMLRYEHRIVGTKLVPWGAAYATAGKPFSDTAAISAAVGGLGRLGLEYEPVPWFSAGPMGGFSATFFIPKDSTIDGGSQVGPEVGLSTHLRTYTRSVDAGFYVLNRWAGDSSAVYAGVQAVLGRPFMLYGEYRLAQSLGTTSATGLDRFAATMPAAGRFGLGLQF